METKTKTCGLPQLLHFEPHPLSIGRRPSPCLYLTTDMWERRAVTLRFCRQKGLSNSGTPPQTLGGGENDAFLRIRAANIKTGNVRLGPPRAEENTNKNHVRLTRHKFNFLWVQQKIHDFPKSRSPRIQPNSQDLSPKRAITRVSAFAESMVGFASWLWVVRLFQHLRWFQVWKWFPGAFRKGKSSPKALLPVRFHEKL